MVDIDTIAHELALIHLKNLGRFHSPSAYEAGQDLAKQYFKIYSGAKNELQQIIENNKDNQVN